MIHRPSPRRSFLGNLLSAAAALGALGTGALSSLVAACTPAAKYGGPPPERNTPNGGPTPVDIDPTEPEDGSAPSEPEPQDAGETEPADGSAFAQPPPAATSTGEAPPVAVPKYGGPPLDRPTTKYGGPPMNVPKYGGPARKYGGPPPTGY